MQMNGTLFKYGSSSANVAFKTGAHRRHVIMVGGLTDGLFACKYVQPLAEALTTAGWSLVQTLLSSSHQGYGIASLDQDATELIELTKYLQSHFFSEEVAIVGHSTGCQDAVRYVRTLREKGTGVRLPSSVVLQAPVSDRESLDLMPSTEAKLKLAEELIASGKGESLMARDTQEDGTPICARRFQSLAGKWGDDDVFSSDFTDEELNKLLNHMQGVRTLVLMSGSDEYVPQSVDNEVLASRLAKAMSATSYTVEGGSHSLQDHVEEAVQLISDFICKV